jgi:prepilin-type N-terminal cleavage/methylation domain-containing protein
MHKPYLDSRGFTLVELLVVIAIIGILSAVVLISINPAELLRRSRDTGRMNDLVVMRKAIDATMASGAADLLGTAVSCTFANPCKGTSTSSRNVDGTGWAKVNLSGNVGVLPVDPNTTAYPVGGTSHFTSNSSSVAPGFYFAVSGSDYRIASYVESSTNVSKLTTDGGPLTGESQYLYEVGTDMTSDLIPN